jgi:hypothetical protein
MQVKLQFWCDIREVQEVLYEADKVMTAAMDKREIEEADQVGYTPPWKEKEGQ